MKILVHAPSLWPQVGGIESVTHTLATGWARAGHSVTVATDTAATAKRSIDYHVVRNPTLQRIDYLVENSDLVQSHSGIRYLPLAQRYRKPFVWTHHTYQLQCLDGFGWHNGQPAPLTPFASFLHHARSSGLIKALRGATRLMAKRRAAGLVSANVAVTKFQMDRQPLPRQRVIYNPIEVDSFAVESLEEAIKQLVTARATFTYLGRLISEKGVDDLLQAFSYVTKSSDRTGEDRNLSLKIIGDGPEKQKLRDLSSELGIADQLVWAGERTGEELMHEVRTAGICIIPSAWQEPMGIVALELMAAGKPLVVSATGGLSEIAADASLTFRNRDAMDLARAMRELYESRELQEDLIRRGLSRIKTFDPESSIYSYLELFQELLGKSG